MNFMLQNDLIIYAIKLLFTHPVKELEVNTILACDNTCLKCFQQESRFPIFSTIKFA